MIRTLLLLATLLGALPPGAKSFTVGPGSELHFAITHKFHHVEGVSRALTGKVVVLPDGRVQAMVRAPSLSFGTGNSNRDAHMKEVIEAEKYPLVELKAVGSAVQLPAPGATTQATLQAQVTFHGVQHQYPLPVTLTAAGGGRYTADGKLDLSLDAFQVERPSLLFVKIEDALPISAHLVLVPEN